MLIPESGLWAEAVKSAEQWPSLHLRTPEFLWACGPDRIQDSPVEMWDGFCGLVFIFAVWLFVLGHGSFMSHLDTQFSGR